MTVCYSDIVGNWLQEGMFLHVSLLITDIGMPMGKSSSLDILPWNSNTISFLKKWGPCQAFHSCPIKRFFVSKIFDSFFIDLSNGWMHMKISWPVSNLMEKLRKNSLRNTSIGSPKSWSANLIDLELILSKLIELIRNDFFIVCLIDLCKLFLYGLDARSINHSLFN